MFHLLGQLQESQSVAMLSQLLSPLSGGSSPENQRQEKPNLSSVQAQHQVKKKKEKDIEIQGVKNYTRRLTMLVRNTSKNCGLIKNTTRHSLRA